MIFRHMMGKGFHINLVSEFASKSCLMENMQIHWKHYKNSVRTVLCIKTCFSTSYSEPISCKRLFVPAAKRYMAT